MITEPLKETFDLSDSQLGALGGLAYSLPLCPVCSAHGLVSRSCQPPHPAEFHGYRMEPLHNPQCVCRELCELGGCAGRRGNRGGTGVARQFVADCRYLPPAAAQHCRGVYYSGAAAGQFVIFVFRRLDSASFQLARKYFSLQGYPVLILAGLLFFTTREPVRAPSIRSNGNGRPPKACSVGRRPNKL